MSSQDYYKILNISSSAKADEIKKAYYALAKKYHPDVNKNSKSAEEKLKKINEAYAVLKNQHKRRAYDQSYKKKEQIYPSAQSFYAVRQLSRRRMVALCLIVFYFLFLSTGLNKKYPFDVQNIITESGKTFSRAIFQTKDAAIRKFILSETAKKILFMSVKKDFYSLVEFELQHGANPNMTDESGYSLLMWAQSIRTAQLLIEKGADVNYQSPDGYTAYARAVKFENGLAPLLRQNGARLIWKKEISQPLSANKSKN